MISCNCVASDAWRCAVTRGRSTESCHCMCHYAHRQGDIQYEFVLNDWRAMSSAPRNARWVEVDTGKEIIRAHFAEDLTGEEQPPFSGWFQAQATERWSNADQRIIPDVTYFVVRPSPKRWRPLDGTS